LARAKRTARAEARRRYRAEHPLGADGLAEEDDAEDGGEADELDDAPVRGRRAPATRASAPRPSGAPAGGRPVRMGAMRAFREAYQPADVRADLRALPELIRSRAVLLPALLVVISAVVLVLAVQLAPGEPGLPGSSSAPSASATAAATAAPASPATSPGASPAPSGAASGGAQTVAGSPLGIIASIMALLFLGIPSPPAIGGIYLSAILAKRSSYLAGGIAGLLGSLGALAAVVVISPKEATGSVAVFGQILLTSVVFGVLIGAGLGYYRRLLRLMNPTPNRPANRPKPSARRR
jgi:hypothetical protein